MPEPAAYAISAILASCVFSTPRPRRASECADRGRAGCSPRKLFWWTWWFCPTLYGLPTVFWWSRGESNPRPLCRSSMTSTCLSAARRALCQPRSADVPPDTGWSVGLPAPQGSVYPTWVCPYIDRPPRAERLRVARRRGRRCPGEPRTPPRPRHRSRWQLNCFQGFTRPPGTSACNQRTRAGVEFLSAPVNVSSDGVRACARQAHESRLGLAPHAPSDSGPLLARRRKTHALYGVWHTIVPHPASFRYGLISVMLVVNIQQRVPSALTTYCPSK